MALGNLGVDGVTAGNALPVAIETPDGDTAMDDTNDAVRVNIVAGSASNVAGDVAHDDADSGNPIKIGGKAVARTSVPTDVAANDRVNLWVDVNGAPGRRQEDRDRGLAEGQSPGPHDGTGWLGGDLDLGHRARYHDRNRHEPNGNRHG